jgi:hypothetical protein
MSNLGTKLPLTTPSVPKIKPSLEPGENLEEREPVAVLNSVASPVVVYSI